jgi:hypothetical protein
MMMGVERTAGFLLRLVYYAFNRKIHIEVFSAALSLPVFELSRRCTALQMRQRLKDLAVYQLPTQLNDSDNLPPSSRANWNGNERGRNPDLLRSVFDDQERFLLQYKKGPQQAALPRKAQGVCCLPAPFRRLQPVLPGFKPGVLPSPIKICSHLCRGNRPNEKLRLPTQWDSLHGLGGKS